MLCVAYLEFLSLESNARSKDLLYPLGLAGIMVPPATRCSEMPVGLSSLPPLSVSEKEEVLEGRNTILSLIPSSQLSSIVFLNSPEKEE